mgnify:CR=1 FL=1
MSEPRSLRQRLHSVAPLRQLGPGLITGAADDDPSGIATYSQGGAQFGILPASMGDIPLDFDTLQPYGCFIGSAAVMILSQHDRARDAALNLLRFFAEESCGQCTPCRVGTEKSVGLMKQARWDKPLRDDLSQAMADASICGWG